MKRNVPPHFGIGMMSPSLKYSGTISFVHNLLHIFVSSLTSSVPPCWCISADIPSLGYLPFSRS